MESTSGYTFNTAQLRAGRALMGWSQKRMAEETGVPLRAIREGEGKITARNIDGAGATLCMEALERVGVMFLSLEDDNGEQCFGVAFYPPELRPPKKPNLRLVVDNA